MPLAEVWRAAGCALSLGAAAVGQTIASLGLDDINVTLSGLRRQGRRDVNPAADTQLAVSDVLVLAGTPEALARAEMRIMQG